MHYKALTWRQITVHSFHMDHSRNSRDTLNEGKVDSDCENHLNEGGPVPGKHDRLNKITNIILENIHQH